MARENGRAQREAQREAKAEPLKGSSWSDPSKATLYVTRKELIGFLGILDKETEKRIEVRTLEVLATWLADRRRRRWSWLLAPWRWLTGLARALGDLVRALREEGGVEYVTTDDEGGGVPCGIMSPSLGYGACTRPKGHPGPCDRLLSAEARATLEAQK